MSYFFISYIEKSSNKKKITNIGQEKLNHIPNLLTKVVPQAKINLVKQPNFQSNTAGNDRDVSLENNNHDNVIMSLWSQAPKNSTTTKENININNADTSKSSHTIETFY